MRWALLALLLVSIIVSSSCAGAPGGVSPEEFREGSFLARVPSIIKTPPSPLAYNDVVPLGRNSVPASAVEAASKALRGAAQFVFSYVEPTALEQLQSLIEHPYAHSGALLLYASSAAVEDCARAASQAGAVCVPVPDRVQPDLSVLWVVHAALTAASGAQPSKPVAFLALARRPLDRARAFEAVTEGMCDVHVWFSPAGAVESLVARGGGASSRAALAAAHAMRSVGLGGGEGTQGAAESFWHALVGQAERHGAPAFKACSTVE